MINYWEIITIVGNVLAHISIFSIFTILSGVHFASAFVCRFVSNLDKIDLISYA